MGVRGDRPHPLPSPEGRGEAGEKLHFDRNEGEGWPEYTHAETIRWRERTEKRLQRLARNKRARRVKVSVSFVAMTDRERIRAEIRAAVERVKAKKKK